MPRQVVDTPTPAVFKARLDKALNKHWEMSLPMAAGLGADGL